MKKYALFLLMLLVGVSASARTNVYDLKSFYIANMPVYRATPDKAQQDLGKAKDREGYLTQQGGYVAAPYFGWGWGPWYPWGFGMSYSYAGRPQLLGTMVLQYDKMVIYFDQQQERGEALIANANIYTPQYPLYYGDRAIRVGDPFESLSTIFPDEYAKALKKSKKEVFYLKLKVEAGSGVFEQKGKIVFIIKNRKIDAIEIELK